MRNVVQSISVGVPLPRSHPISILLSSLLGALFFSVCSQIALPLPLVPITLQTFALFLLVITQGKERACLSLILHLVGISCGFPILAGGLSDPLWFLGTRAGYLIGFPVTAYVMGGMMSARSHLSFSRLVFIFSCGQLIVYLVGVSVLSSMVGAKMGMMWGMFPFLLGDGIKILCGAWVGSRIFRCSSLFTPERS